MQHNFRPSGFSILPPVVKNLLIINGLSWLIGFVLEKRFGFDLNRQLGLFYPESTYFKPYQLITHIFMHGDFTHLFFNMFSLWMFGSVLENYWGAKRFFIYYFVTGLGAAAIHLGFNAYELFEIKQQVNAYLANPGYNTFYDLHGIGSRLLDWDKVDEFVRDWSTQKNNPEYIAYSKEVASAIIDTKLNIPTVGASGAVFGLLLAYGMLFPNTLLMLIFLPIPIKAKYFVAFYGLLELYQGIANNPADNVAHFAHLGGMLFGFVLVKWWNKTRRDTFY